MRKKKTVLLLSFIFSPNIGGVESHLDDLCSYLSGKNFNLKVITYQPIVSKINAPNYEKKKNIEIYRIPWLKNLFNKLEAYPLLQMLYLIPGILLFSFFYLLRRKKEIDIIQTHGFNMAIVGYILSFFFRKQFTVNTHVLFYFEKNSLYAIALAHILNKAKKTLVLTKGAKDQLESIGVKREKIIVYHQWIDTELFKPFNKLKSRRKYHFPKEAFILLFTGRLVSAKGIPILLEAIHALSNRKDIHFVITGSGELEGDILREANYNAQLHFLGRVAKKELPIFYSLADICIFPSIQATKRYAEGIPRVMIEALTCGTPLIATKTGGVEEVINQHIGFFVNPTITSIIKLISQLSKRKKELYAMRNRCIVYVHEKFGLYANAKIIEKSL